MSLSSLLKFRIEFLLIITAFGVMQIISVLLSDQEYYEYKLKEFDNIEENYKIFNEFTKKIKIDQSLFDSLKNDLEKNKSLEKTFKSIDELGLLVQSNQTNKVYITKDLKQKGFKKIGISISVSGTYDQLIAYFEGLQKIPSLFQIDNWGFENTQTESVNPMIGSNIILGVYTLKN
mgnify:CR=1 FL=1